MKHIRKISEYAMVGGFGAILVLGISGCEKKDNSNAFYEATKKEGAFVVIEEVKPKEYKIVEEYPSSQTRVILRDINKSERILTKEEIEKLIKEEEEKISSNQTPLTNPQIQNPMSLGEIILASAAGAIIGSWLGNRLFNNPVYQNQRKSGYKNPSVYQKSVDSFKKRAASTNRNSQTKKGFFSKNGPSSKSRFTFGG